MSYDKRHDASAVPINSEAKQRKSAAAAAVAAAAGSGGEGSDAADDWATLLDAPPVIGGAIQDLASSSQAPRVYLLSQTLSFAFTQALSLCVSAVLFVCARTLSADSRQCECVSVWRMACANTFSGDVHP